MVSDLLRPEVKEAIGSNNNSNSNANDNSNTERAINTKQCYRITSFGTVNILGTLIVITSRHVACKSVSERTDETIMLMCARGSRSAWIHIHSRLELRSVAQHGKFRGLSGFGQRGRN